MKFRSVEFSFSKTGLQSIQQVIPRKVRIHWVIDRPIKARGLNQKDQNWTIIRKSVNVEKLFSPFLRGQPLLILRGILHAKQSEMQTFETIRIFLQFLFAAIALPLNNNSCLSVCFFRMLSDNPVEIIGSDAFTVPGRYSRNDLLV